MLRFPGDTAVDLWPQHGLGQYGQGMEGIEIAQVRGGTVVVVRSISDDFRAHIRERLADYCYGAAEVSENLGFYSFKRTVAEFLERYAPKPPKTKIGMAGELIAHMLMPILHADLTPAAIYFNKEERSIKKGFDLTFLSSTESAIWYGEVKSGMLKNNRHADDKAVSLVNKAATSLALMLEDATQLSRWNAALTDTRLTLEGGYAETARDLLRSDSDAVRAGTKIEKRVVLVGTVMHDLGHCIVTNDRAELIVETITKSARFTSSRILVIQQDALESVIEYLREVANG